MPKSGNQQTRCRTRRAACLVACAWSLAAATASLAQVAPPPTAPPPAQPSVPDLSGTLVTIELTSGETIRGVLKSRTVDKIVLTHPVLGDVTIPRSGIAKSDPPVDAVAASTAPEAKKTKPEPEPERKPEPKPEPKKDPKPEPPKPAPPPAPPVPKPEDKKESVKPANPLEALFADDEKPFWKGWNRSVEFGLNGSTGASDNQNYRAFLNTSRNTSKMSTVASFQYNYGRNNSGVSQDRGEFTGRNEWKLGHTPWNFWASSRAELNSRARWDARLSLSTGLGYTILKDEKILGSDVKATIVARGGAGGTREFGSTNENAILPEVGVFGVNADFVITDKVKAYANTEYYPSGKDWDWDNFRSTTRAGLNIVVDPELKMNLRLGLEHRHDSEQRSDRNNVLDYFVVLGFAF